MTNAPIIEPQKNKVSSRIHPRFSTQALVWWQRDWEPEPVTLMDISAGGMLVEFPVCLTLGEHIQLHFEIPDRDGLINALCTVAHVRPGNPPFTLTGLSLVKLEGITKSEFMTLLQAGSLPCTKDQTKGS